MRKEAVPFYKAKTAMKILSCVAISAFFLCGCGAAVIGCNSDEIRASSWEYCAENGMCATLEFNGDCAILTIQNEERSALIIDGLCVADEKTIVILGDDDKYIFDYRLSGKTMTLTYKGNDLVFHKAQSLFS